MSSIKQVTENPAPNAVTSPTDRKLKAADIEQKMKLYQVVEAFRQGRYPSNQQIDNTLDHVVNNSPIETSKLSAEGKTLIEDFRKIIKTAKTIVAEKNADELFQNFLYHSRHVDYSKGDVTKVDTPVTKDDLSKDGDQAVEHLRTLGKLIFTNSEARKLLKDIGLLGRDVAADGAAKLSDVARPADHELAKVDEPAPSNQWVGPNGETRSHNEPVPDTGIQSKVDQAQELKSNAQDVASDAAQQAGDHAQAAGSRVANSADSAQQGHTTDEARAGAAKDAGAEQAKAEAAKLDEKAEKSGLKDKVLNLHQQIPDEHKEKAKEQYNKAKDYAKEKFPQERRDRFIYRLKKVVVENQRHRDYQEAIEFFLDRAEHYGGHAKNLTGDGADQALQVRDDNAFQAAEKELRTLLERFANGQSMQPIFDAVNQIYTDAKNDSELRAWFSKLDTYLRKVLQEPGYIMRESSDKEGQALMDEGKRYWDPTEGKYAGHKDRVFDSISTFFTAYADDALNVQLGEDVKKLTKDLLMDGDGNLKYKSHLWNDVREVILPALAKNVGYVPIPRIEYTDSKIDAVIENLTLESANLLPNVIEIEARNYFKVSPYDAIKDASKHSFWVSFSQIQADLKDVAWYIKKKSGFPKLTDSGLADVFIGGKGISGKIHVESTGRKDHAFKVIEVKVKIDKLTFAVRESKFSFLISTFKPLATGLIKKAVAKAIEEGIRSGLVQLDAQLADISERLDEAKGNDDVSRVDVVKQVFNEKKSTAEEAKESVGQFQITAQRDNALVDWHSKDSMVLKQGLAQDRASDSSGWKSPAFDIVGTSLKNPGAQSTGTTGVGRGASNVTGATTAPMSTTTAATTAPTTHSTSSNAATTAPTYSTGAAAGNGYATSAAASKNVYDSNTTTAGNGYATSPAPPAVASKGVVDSNATTGDTGLHLGAVTNNTT